MAIFLLLPHVYITIMFILFMMEIYKLAQWENFQWNYVNTDIHN
jgi:hypothetical protein